ncbi:slr1306 family protein [Phormidesmis sp. 146-33]
MTVQLQRSLILGGVGLALLTWLLESLSSMGDWTPAIVLGSGIAWLFLKFQSSLTTVSKAAVPMNLTTVKTALSEAEGVVNQLASEVQDLTIDGSAQQLSELRSQIHQIAADLHRDQIRLAVMGGKSVGKTTLTQLLKAHWAANLSQLTLEDTPELFSAEGIIAEQTAWKRARSADLILFITNGDLTATEFQAMQKLAAAHKRIILVFNKQDQYLPEEQQAILHQLRQRSQGMLSELDVVAIATCPQPVKVRRHESDGTINEWLEQRGFQIAPLVDRLNEILLHEGQQLVLASSLGNAKELRTEAKKALNQVRRDRALPVIDQSQWIVATTTFANPFPALDLLATAAINVQMVMDLGSLYQQKFSLSQAKTVASTMAGLMMKLGLVEVSTQAIAAILKTNMVTYVAGGLMQGVSAAYLTRLAGLTLIEYFEGEAAGEPVKRDPFGVTQRDRLQQVLETVFQQNQRISFLQMFVKQAVDRLKPSTPTQPPAPVQQFDALPKPQEEPLQLGVKLVSEPEQAENIPLELPVAPLELPVAEEVLLS